MKNKYLEDLRKLLDEYQMEDSEKEDILSDYSEMYDNWTDYGMPETEIENKLGKPRSIISELVEGYRRIVTKSSKSNSNNSKKSIKSKNSNNEKYIALTPFIALIAFFIIGFVYDGWVYGWMVFLLIPMTAIVLQMRSARDPHMLTALSPFLITITYMYLGLVHDLWHPGWMLYILIPIIAILTERKTMTKLNLLVSLSPFAAAIAFVYLGTQDLWVPGWVVFLIIPMLGILNEKRLGRLLLWELLFIVGIGGYLYVGYTFEEWSYALIAFVPLVLFAISQDEEGIKDMPLNYRIVVVVSILLYIALGILFNAWGWAWMIILAIPVYAIIKEVKGPERTIALTPFIALVIFFSLGWIFGWWAFSWMAFLIIPVVAIIKNV